jgi:hypothetical protein
MIRAAALAIMLSTRQPLAEPCPLLMDDAALPPFEGIQPGFWARLRGWQT